MIRGPLIGRIALCATALVVAALPAFAQGVKVNVWPLPPGGTVGDTIAVQLRVLQAGTPFNAYEAVVHYDPSALQFVPRTRALQEGSSMQGACNSTFYQFAAAGDSISIMNSLLCNQVTLRDYATLLDLRFVLTGPEEVTWIRFSHLVVYSDGSYVTPAVGVDAPVWIVRTLGVDPRPRVIVPHLGVAPNPARGDVEFAIERGGDWAGDLLVCDMTGRVVRRLLSADGSTRLAVWNGRADDGVPAPPGVYWAVFRGEHRSIRTRFVRLR